MACKEFSILQVSKVLVSVTVYLSLDQGNGSNGRLESPDFSGRSGDQRRTSVHNGFTASLTKGQLTANGHTEETNPQSC